MGIEDKEEERDRRNGGIYEYMIFLKCKLQHKKLLTIRPVIDGQSFSQENSTKVDAIFKKTVFRKFHKKKIGTYIKFSMLYLVRKLATLDSLANKLV